MGEGEISFCGLRKNENGKLKSKVNENFGLLYSYFDGLPTNCCASWFCPGSIEGRGENNLAIFFYGCSFDCLFCQNASHKLIDEAPRISVKNLLEKAMDPSVYCLCFFGGSPEPQLPFVINFSEKLLKKRKIRICFEWNGSGNKNLVKRAAEIAFKSKGIIKFDLKAFDENLNFALCGISNKRVYKNFEMLAKKLLPRADYPLLTATTLLVPGYVDKIEVEEISKFIANLNPEIPYSLLVFFPAFEMIDLPITPKEWAFECLEIAKKHLKNVHLGNKHLLGL
jgi:pyruvate formate lyase activating enzyme